MLTIYGMALVVFAHVWVIIQSSLLPLLIVGVEAYDSLGLPLAACKTLEIDSHPSFHIHFKVVHSIQDVHDTGLRLQQGSSALEPSANFVCCVAWYL